MLMKIGKDSLKIQRTVVSIVHQTMNMYEFLFHLSA